MFEFRMAVRFLKEGRGQTVFILLGLVVGVSVQVFLNTLIVGVQNNLIDETVGNSAQVWISQTSDEAQYKEAAKNKNIRLEADDDSSDTMKEWQPILDVLDQDSLLTAVSPLVSGNTNLVIEKEILPIQVKGIDLARADKIYSIKDNLIEGNSDLSSQEILIGIGMSQTYDLHTQDIVGLTLESGERQNFTIIGVFDLGNSVSNDSWIFMDLNQAQAFLGLGNQISRIEMQITDVFDSEEVARHLQSRFENIEVEEWQAANQSLLSALRSQSASSLLIQAFVLLAITLGIASVLAVSVVQKSKQLGILKAMGAKNRQTQFIFLLQGLILGILGSIAGIVAGIGLIEAFIWGTSIGNTQALFPLSIDIESMLAIGFIAIVASTIAAFIPARRTTKLQAIEVIRNG